MPEAITLHCGIPNCNIHFEYQHSDAVLALFAHWTGLNAGNQLLAESPAVGGRYALELNFPVRLDLSHPFWALYMDPYSTHNGPGSDTGFRSIRFCLCRANAVLKLESQKAVLEVEVMDTKSLFDGDPDSNNNRSHDIVNDITARYSGIEHFESFSIVRVDFQGDCGTQSIIVKQEGRSILVAENEWDSHRDTWQLLHENLSPEQERALGIKH